MECGRVGSGAVRRGRQGFGGGRNLDRLNKSQKQLIVIIANHQVGGGYVAFSKRELIEYLGKCGKTVDGAVSNLRRRGLIEAKPRYCGRQGLHDW